ncbi:sugar porter family MFS transporter [Poriferisphaera sp. WC338]|uniref:sugar porter family MFS transporter n=1 Tax=Poriferisphaera sp. WC338 TaxID=3425129 RepID=UPI003D8155DF
MLKHKRILLASSIIAALGGLLFGFDTAVISGTTAALQSRFALTSGGLGFTVAVALIGTIMGALVAGFPADRYGRRFVMFVLAIFYFASALGSALAWDWYSFVVFRFLGGLAVGGASVVAPMYIAEIAPARLRGRLVALAQFNIVLGILLAFLSNYVVAQFGFGEIEWRVMFGVEAFPAAAYFALLFIVPCSPRWLLAKQRESDSRRVLQMVGTDEGRSIDEEVSEIKESLKRDCDARHEPLFQQRYMKPIMLAVAIAMFNQLSGINAILYYAPSIFQSVGASGDSALLQSVGLGLMNLLFTVLAMIVIDFFGRRKLMLIGSVGYIISLGGVTWAFFTQSSLGVDGSPEFTGFGGVVVLVGLLLFIAAHAFGQGAVIWVFISEIFPNNVRARGLALGSFTHWIFAAAISWTFPVIAEASGGFVFAFYGICMVLQLLWVLWVMPETKGVPLEEIQKHLGANVSKGASTVCEDM